MKRLTVFPSWAWHSPDLSEQARFALGKILELMDDHIQHIGLQRQPGNLFGEAWTEANSIIVKHIGAHRPASWLGMQRAPAKAQD